MRLAGHRMAMSNPLTALHLDIDIVNESSESLSYRWDENGFRQDGVTIGPDFWRLEGITISRNVLWPECIELQDIIGRGAFSTVRRARWWQKKRPSSTHPTSSTAGAAASSSAPEDHSSSSMVQVVAIKNCSLLDASPERRKMLLRELRALARLDCIHLVRFYGAFLRPGDEIENEEVAIVLEYMDLGSLRQHIPRSDSSSSSSWQTDREQDQGRRGRRSGFPESILASILYQMISGLVYLHERKILHRDLKTDNVLLNSTGHVKLCDFGVSTILDDSIAMGQTLIGTALYMAPERLRAQPHGSLSDIWSLGLVGLECWTGHVPWSQPPQVRDDENDDNGGKAGSTVSTSHNNSIIELIMTIEETDAQVLVPSATATMAAVDEALRELLIGCLQVQPAKRLPARILLQSPWFANERIFGTDDAVDRLARSLLLQRRATTTKATTTTADVDVDMPPTPTATFSSDSSTSSTTTSS